MRALVVGLAAAFLYLPARALVAMDRHTRRRKAAAGPGAHPSLPPRAATASRAAAFAPHRTPPAADAAPSPGATMPEAMPSPRNELKQALHHLTVSGASEGEVRRLLEACGAEWISSRNQPQVIDVWPPPAASAGTRRKRLRIARTLRFQFPKPQCLADIVLAVPSTITVDFDARGRAVRDRVYRPRFL